jgi:hypothetical protein
VLGVVTASNPAPANKTAAETRLRTIEVNDGRPRWSILGCPASSSAYVVLADPNRRLGGKVSRSARRDTSALGFTFH